MSCPNGTPKSVKKIVRYNVVKRFDFGEDIYWLPPKVTVANGKTYVIRDDMVHVLVQKDGDITSRVIYDNLAMDNTPIFRDIAILGGDPPDMVALSNDKHTVWYLSGGKDGYQAEERVQLPLDGINTNTLYFVNSAVTPDNKVVFAVSQYLFVYDVSEKDVKRIEIQEENPHKYISDMIVIDNSKAVVAYNDYSRGGVEKKGGIGVVDLYTGGFTNLSTSDGDNELEVTEVTRLAQNDEFLAVGGIKKSDHGVILLYNKDDFSLAKIIDIEGAAFDSLNITQDGKHIVYSNPKDVYRVNLETQEINTHGIKSSKVTVLDDGKMCVADVYENVTIIEPQ